MLPDSLLTLYFTCIYAPFYILVEEKLNLFKKYKIRNLYFHSKNENQLYPIRKFLLNTYEG